MTLVAVNYLLLCVDYSLNQRFFAIAIHAAMHVQVMMHDSFVAGVDD